MAEPIQPDAPVTNTRMRNLQRKAVPVRGPSDVNAHPELRERELRAVTAGR